MANLKNGTLNYFLTKDLDALENRENALREMNKMDPTYPDPNDPRFTDPAPVFTILDNLLYRDGNPIGRIYNNKTGKLINITDTLGTNITARDTEDSATRLDIPILTVEKLTGTKFTIEEVPEHDFVEIAGIKWATMNVGANSVTDTGLYFQWGDTQGYTALQVGSGAGQKYFGWADYKYGNGTSSPGAAGMTKYNSTDNKTVLDASDDAVAAAWGGNWRMPTTAEFQALNAAVNTAWTADYQNSGVAGLVCTDKTDSSKTLFFPACGFCKDGSVRRAGDRGHYQSSSLHGSSVLDARGLDLDSGGVSWQNSVIRHLGLTVRGVLDGPTPKFATPSDIPAQVQSDWRSE